MQAKPASIRIELGGNGTALGEISITGLPPIGVNAPGGGLMVVPPPVSSIDSPAINSLPPGHDPTTGADPSFPPLVSKKVLPLEPMPVPADKLICGADRRMSKNLNEPSAEMLIFESELIKPPTNEKSPEQANATPSEKDEV